MGMMYNPEDIRKFIQEEQGGQEPAGNQKEIKKATDTAKKAIQNAQTAFQCAEQNAHEIEELKRQVQKSKRIAIAAIIISVICVAIALGQEFSEMIRMLP